MTEPSNAAKRKACELELKQNGVGQIVVDPLTAEYIKGLRRAFALYIDEVDRVARELARGFGNGSVTYEKLASLMLPDPPDPDEELAREVAKECFPSAEFEQERFGAEAGAEKMIKRLREQGRLTDAK